MAKAIAVAVAGMLAGSLLAYEVGTSGTQAAVFTAWAKRLSFEVGPGPTHQTVPAPRGPFDSVRGYSRLGEFTERLGRYGYTVTSQARVSPELARLLAMGVAPPYREAPVAGLVIRAADGSTLYDATRNSQSFASFDQIPPLIVKTLLLIENQELLDPLHPRSNPAVEWDRLAKAVLLYSGRQLGLPIRVEGGGTLAMQMEKLRHSPRGQTHGPLDKLRQIVGASLKAYHEGPDTTEWRREVIVDYLNTLPLAATPGHGEVHGLGDGLWAWFGLSLEEISSDLSSASPTPAAADAYKHVLALLASLPAPSAYLIENRAALEARAQAYLDLMARRGVISPDFARAVRDVPIRFLASAPDPQPPDFIAGKGFNALRAHLLQVLGLSDLYELDRLHLEVEGSIDREMQAETTRLLKDLTRLEFVQANGLHAEHLLAQGNPASVRYGVLIIERTADGNLLRASSDNLAQQFDVNRGIKMELGSTAKLRTLAHYLEVVEGLHRELAGLEPAALKERIALANDPITRWAAETLARVPAPPLEAFLDRALDRRYSASPGESFFTAGGRHQFRNYDREDNDRIMSVREAFTKSTNLVFVRLMRDLVRFHRARLPYDADAVLRDRSYPERRRLLDEIAARESEQFLARTYRRYHGLSTDQAIGRLLGSRAGSPRHLAILFYAWNLGATEAELGKWLENRLDNVTAGQVRSLVRSYGNPRLTIADYGYLLSRHSLEVWCVGELVRRPELTWAELLSRSEQAQRISSAWLFKTRNRRAQDLRLRVKIEEDAFARMTPAWSRLGFPFKRLVPSYATAIGNSGDRPTALAELMGIIVNGGIRRPTQMIRRLVFARDTPYETVFQPDPGAGERVMHEAVAVQLHSLLAGVVEHGTARRVAGAFLRSDGSPAVVGGKTGTGDNRFRTFTRSGGERSARSLNRTATFAFYIDDRYYGVVTAFVPGERANEFEFTSALPVAILKLLAPTVSAATETCGQDSPGQRGTLRNSESPSSDNDMTASAQPSAVTSPTAIDRCSGDSPPEELGKRIVPG